MRQQRKVRARLLRGICRACGREVAVKVPKGGDGSVVYPVRHLIAGRAVVCSGVYFEANGLPTTDPEGS